MSERLRLRILPQWDGTLGWGEQYMDVELPDRPADIDLRRENEELRRQLHDAAAATATLTTEIALLRRRYRPWWSKVVGR